MKKIFKILFAIFFLIIIFSCAETTDNSEIVFEETITEEIKNEILAVEEPIGVLKTKDIDYKTEVIFFSPNWKDEYNDFKYSNKGLNRAVEHTIKNNIGDAILILAPEKTILIDVGLPGRCEYQIIPYLKEQGRKKIDKLIITHPHFDHYGGGIHIVENYPVDNVYICGTEHPSNAYKYFLEQIKKRDIGFYKAEEQQYLDFGKGIEAIVLKSNVPEFNDSSNYNNHSIYIRMKVKDIIFLFTGDGEYEAEDYLLKKGYDLNAHILKVGHHGSKSSTFYPFLKKVDPEVSIVTVGIDNAYGLPAQIVMNRLAIYGTKIYRTDYLGNIKVATDGETYQVTYQNEPEFENNNFDISDEVRDEYLKLESEGEYALRYNRFTSAISSYSNALRLFDGDATLHQKLGYSYRRISNHREAEKMFRKALEINPDEPYSHLYLGLHYYNRNNIRSAGYHLTRFRELMPFSTISEFVDERLESINK